MKIHNIKVKVNGLAPIMFDKFHGQSKSDTSKPPKDKLYLDGSTITFPIDNIWAFLTCQRTGCIKVLEGKGFMDYYRACQSFVRIMSTDPLPIVDEKNEPIRFDNFKKKTYIYTTNVIVGTGKNISRNTIQRPVLQLPWSVEFDMSLVDNDKIKASKLEEWLRAGGALIGWGNGRPKFGRFEVVMWDIG